MSQGIADKNLNCEDQIVLLIWNFDRGLMGSPMARVATRPTSGPSSTGRGSGPRLLTVCSTSTGGLGADHDGLLHDSREQLSAACYTVSGGAGYRQFSQEEVGGVRHGFDEQ